MLVAHKVGFLLARHFAEFAGKGEANKRGVSTYLPAAIY